MKVVSPKKTLVSEDIQSIKKFALIIVLVGLIVGTTFTLARVDFGEFTPVIATLLTAMTAIVVKIMEKYFGTSEYVGRK